MHQEVANLKGHTSSIRALSCTEDFVFTGSYDQTMRIWDMRQFQSVQSFAKSSSVRSILSLGEVVLAADATCVSLYREHGGSFEHERSKIPSFVLSDSWADSIREQPSLFAAGFHFIVRTASDFGVMDRNLKRELYKTPYKAHAFVGSGDRIFCVSEDNKKSNLQVWEC